MELVIVWLVRAVWVAVLLPLVIASIPISNLSSFRELVLGFSGRGKILHPSSSQVLICFPHCLVPGFVKIYNFLFRRKSVNLPKSCESASVSVVWNLIQILRCMFSLLVQKLTVPQKFFAHFYVIGVAWTTLLLAATLMYTCKMMPLTSEEFQYYGVSGASHVFSFHKSHWSSVEHRFKVRRAVFLLLLMEMQVLRRLFESIYVFKYSPSARMHIFGYLTGLFFYTAAPFSLCSNIAPEVAKFARSQVVEFISNGKNRTSTPKFDSLFSVSPLMKLEPCQWIGGAIFFWGWIHQRRCHAILGSLRKNPRQANEYIIPHGDWFEMVSCPHYLAEIVLYVGVLIASGGTDITIWLLLGFVVGNLTMAAGETHQWYLQKFENYPANRRAIFPYVY